MGFFATLAITAAFWLISYALRDKPETPGEITDRTPKVPTAEEGMSVPLVWGRVRIDAPNVTWYHIATNIVNGSNNYTITMMASLGLPMMDGTSITASHNKMYKWWKDDRLMWDGEVSDTPIKPEDITELGDGDTEDSGFCNHVRFHTGTWLQHPDNHMLEVFTDSSDYDVTLMPGYRGLMYAVLVFVTGPSGSCPKPAFEIKTSTDPLSLGPVNDDGDANPAEVIYDILVNPWGRLGMSTSRVDSASFIAAGTTLASEEHGYSLAQFRDADAQALIANVLKEIDAVVYEDLSDHTVKLKLIRADYTAADLKVYDESDILKVDEYTTMTWKETINQVRLDYTNRSEDYTTRSVFAQDMANVSIQDGEKKSTIVKYPGICNAELANKIVWRELKTVSLPLAKLRLIVNRNATDLRPGDVFKFSWDDYGITEMILRVIRFDLGTLDSNQVKVECVQDRFASTLDAFGIQDPILPIATVDPHAVTYDALIETPWFLGYLAQQEGLIADQLLSRVYYMAKKPSYAASFAGKPSDDGTTFVVDKSGMYFVYTADVETSYSKLAEPYDTTTGLRIDALTAALTLETATTAEIQAGKNLIMVDDEFMAFSSFTDIGSGVYRLDNVWRGLLDTVPAAHAADAVVYFVRSQDDIPLGNEVFSGDESLRIKLIPRNGMETLNPNDAPITSLQLASRPRLPVRPQRMLMDQDYTITGTNDPGTITENAAKVAWNRRERDKTIINRGDDLDDTESGTVYDVHCKVERDAAWTALSGDVNNDYNYSEFQTMGHGPAEVRLTADDGTYHAFQKPTIDFTLARYRQLLLNPTFNDDDGNGGLEHWTVDLGTPGVTPSNPLDADGYSVTDGEVWSLSQIVDINKFSPVGFDARLRFYAYGDSSATVTVYLHALNSSDVSQGSVNTGTLTPSASWDAHDLAYTDLPATTTKLKVVISSSALVQLDEFDLRVGDHTTQLLLNPQFNAATTSWTASVGTWAVNTPAFEGANSLGTTTITGIPTIYQEVLLSTGYDRGTAWLKGWMAIVSSASDKVIMKLEALNGTNSLGSVSTGELSYAADSAWHDNDLYLDIPDTADRLRVTLTAVNGTASSIRIDDLQLVVFKDLHPDAHDDHADFSTPTTQTWPATQIAWEDLGVDEPTAIWPFSVEDIDDVVWDDLRNVTATNNSIEKTSGGSSWSNGGAVSTRALYGDCCVEFTVEETDKYRVIGLSNDDTNYHTDIDFGIILRNTSQRYMTTENGSTGATYYGYQTGDVFRIQCLNNVVTYWRNGELFATSSETPTYPLLVDAFFYHQNGTFKNVEFGQGAEFADSIDDNSDGQYHLDRRGSHPVTVAGFYDGTDLLNKAGFEVASGDISGAQFHSANQLSIDGTNSFAIAVVLRAHDVASGWVPIMGSMKTAQGWTVGMDSGGQVRASVASTTSTQNLDLTEDHTGAVPHYVVFQYNATTGYFRIWSDLQSATAIVVPPTGSMINLAKVLIGCDPTTGGLDAQFTYGTLWTGTPAKDLTPADTALWWNHAQDPSGFIDTYAPDDIITGPVGIDSGSIIIGGFSPDQIPLIYNAELDNEKGLSLHKAQTNLGDADPNSSSWVEEGSPTVHERAGADAERFYRSVRLSTDNADAYRPPAITLGAGNVTVVWYAKGDSSHNGRLVLWDDTKATSITYDFAVTTSWSRYSHTFAWAGSTATFELWFHGSDDATERVIELSRPLGVFSGDEAPFVIHPRTAALSAAVCSLNNVLPDEFNEEGEVLVAGVATLAEPGNIVIVDVKNGTDSNDRKYLYSNGTGSYVFAHYDGAGSAQYDEITTSWDGGWEIRGRWNIGGLLEDRTYFNGAHDPSTDNYGRTATFSVTAVLLDEIDFGAFGGLVSDVRLSSRERTH